MFSLIFVLQYRSFVRGKNISHRILFIVLFQMVMASFGENLKD